MCAVLFSFIVLIGQRGENRIRVRVFGFWEILTNGRDNRWSQRH